MPHEAIIQKVVSSICALPNWKDLHVLDLSCGDGEIIETLTGLGGHAEGTHYKPDDYIYRAPSPSLDKVPIHQGVNLCKPLPFPDATYDVVVATEVLEHLFAHSELCFEVGRILKKEGRFIFTTPNIHRISSRIVFMLTGQHDLKGGRLGWNTPREDLYSTHHNPVYFPTAHTLLYMSGLKVQKIVRTMTKLENLFFFLLYPLIYLFCLLEVRHLKKGSPACARDLFRWMVSPQILLSEHLMVISKKDPS